MFALFCCPMASWVATFWDDVSRSGIRFNCLISLLFEVISFFTKISLWFGALETAFNFLKTLDCSFLSVLSSQEKDFHIFYAFGSEQVSYLAVLFFFKNILLRPDGSNSPAARFYGLPKIHKNNMSMHPIVFTCGIATCNTTKFINKIL